MQQDVRSSGGSFDFNSQAGVLQVLQAIRSSGIPLAERNELRDLVFSYANGGGDQAVRTLLQDRLAALNITPDLAPKTAGKETSTPKSVGFSAGRPMPQFVTHATYTPPVVAAVKVAAAPLPEVETVVVAPVVPAAPVVTEPTPVAPPLQETRRIEPVIPVVPVSAAPAPAPVRTEVGVQAVLNSTVPVRATAAAPRVDRTPVPEPVVTPAVPVAAAPQNPVPPPPLSAPVSSAYVDRIRDIKASINAKVGNPVNLVDIDNVLGREYMSSLLEAMKQIGSGASDFDISRAMQRLENVYTQVIAKIEQVTPVIPEPVIPVVTEPVAPVVPAPMPPRPVEPPVVSTPIPVVVEPPYTPSPVITAVPVIPPVVPAKPAPVAEFATKHIVVTDSVVDTPQVTTAMDNEPAQVVLSKHDTPIQNETVPRTKIVVRPPVSSEPNIVMDGKAASVVSSIDAPSIQITSTRQNFGQPVASAVPLKSPSDLPTAAEVRTNSEAGLDPLFTKEIDDGLEQLLSEWSLFKKSGIFGTGPKGHEHPLFKKIAPLQIPLILSGRFEGATQEIRQSITDYMNGWRYEQGIIYEKDETFERYLRRVIRHIIDWQNRGADA